MRGFYRGIYLNDDYPYTTSQGHMIEDIRADMNTYQGIIVEGHGNIIRNNQVVDTGGSTHITSARGIFAGGPGVRVINNDVYETKEQQVGSTAYGIDLSLGDGSVVLNNRVGNQDFGPGHSYGINISLSYGVIVKDNAVSRMENGIYFITSAGLYMNNLVGGCTTVLTGGLAAGSTNYSIP